LEATPGREKQEIFPPKQAFNRQQFEDMNKAIDAWKIKPVIDPEIFKFEDLKEAYRYLVSDD